MTLQQNSPLLLHEVLDSFVRVSPHKMAVRDINRTLTYIQWSERSERLAQSFQDLGLHKGDRVGVIAWNCLEWLEIYVAAAKSGIVVVPINFRLSPQEILYILKDCDASALLAQEGLHEQLDVIRDDLSILNDHFIYFGGTPPAHWLSYEKLIETAVKRDFLPSAEPEDPWTIMYTSGTTGAPKGVIRDHHGMAMLALTTDVELSIGKNDHALLVMPLCHANSLNFFCAFAYAGAAITIYARRHFDAQELLEVMGQYQCSFTSMVPTQYIMMLSLPDHQRNTSRLECVTKLMISSAPARAETKRDIMRMFPKAGLFELYGSSEAGWVTMLHPDEQFKHLGTVGRECIGSAAIKLIDDHGNEVPDGCLGELYSRTPYTFSGYWNLPDKTAAAFRGGWCSVGDMAIRDKDGFIKLVDRKNNMIISGGENIYPSEIEAILAQHEAVQDVAIIGIPHTLWGEAVHAIVVLCPNVNITEIELVHWCVGKIAGYKRPRSVSIIKEENMPRTATGKILHRVLRQRHLKNTLVEEKI